MDSRRRPAHLASERKHHDAWFAGSVVGLPSFWAVAVLAALLVLFPFTATAPITMEGARRWEDGEDLRGFVISIALFPGLPSGK